jgi:hypothetical protein
MPDAVTPTATPDAAPAAAAAPAATPAAPATEPAKAAPAADPKADLEKQWAEFKPVEGFDKEALKEIVAFAQKEGIPPKAAVALAQREQARAAKEEADFKHLSEKGWLEELNKDPDLGGPKVRETMVNVMRASDRLDPKVQALIKEHGVLYNPVVVRILHDIGSKMKEDSFVRPGASPAPEQKKSLDQRLESLWAGK